MPKSAPFIYLIILFTIITNLLCDYLNLHHIKAECGVQLCISWLFVPSLHHSKHHHVTAIFHFKMAAQFFQYFLAHLICQTRDMSLTLVFLYSRSCLSVLSAGHTTAGLGQINAAINFLIISLFMQ